MNYAIIPQIVTREYHKFELMEFVYNNTDTFVMNTFGQVWENRQWWNHWNAYIDLYYTSDPQNPIGGLHAYTCNIKDFPQRILKTYYIVVNKNLRGQGIGKTLTLHALNKHKNDCDTFFVNSMQGSSGVEFYKKFFTDKCPPEIIPNGLGSKDYVFKAPIKDFV